MADARDVSKAESVRRSALLRLHQDRIRTVDNQNILKANGGERRTKAGQFRPASPVLAIPWIFAAENIKMSC